MERKTMILADTSHRHHAVAERLEILLSGVSHDIFAADVYYHQSCYIKFVINSTVCAPNEDDSKKNLIDDVLYLFNYKIRTRIIRDKEAYLLHELLKDIVQWSTEHGLEEAAIEHTVGLKRYLTNNFENELAFFPSGRHVLVHPIDINPCTYSAATLKGCGLRDVDLSKAFGRMIRRKLTDRTSSESSWPKTPDELLSLLDQGVLPELYNALFYSMHENGKINEYGYCVTSNVAATKIWGIASDWESMVTRERSPKQIVLGLVLHRLTASKEGINMLHKTNHVISYNDIRLQNKSWARMVSSNPLHFPRFRKGITTHSTVDNNDGSQETWTGKGTTHDTNKTLFQVPSKEELNIPVIGEVQAPLVLNEEPINWNKEPLPYTLGKRVGPPLLPDLQIERQDNLLEESLMKDIAWSLCGAIVDEELPLIGSWTAFNKMVSSHDSNQIVQEYLPVSPHPPEYPVCKEYLDFLLDIIEELEIPFILCAF